MGQAEVKAFLSWLADDRHVSASTHTRALSALLFQYGKVLGQQLPWLQDIGRPGRPRHVLQRMRRARLCDSRGTHRALERPLERLAVPVMTPHQPVDRISGVRGLREHPEPAQYTHTVSLYS